MRLVKTSPFWFVCFMLAATLLNLWHGRHNEAQFASDLGAAVQHLQSTQDRLKLAHITRFNWDRMFVFPPNTPISEISKLLGRPVPTAITGSGIEQRDDIHLLVFLDGESIAQVSAISRSTADFFVGLVGISLAYNNAVFAKAQGERTLALAAF